MNNKNENLYDFNKEKIDEFEKEFKKIDWPLDSMVIFINDLIFYNANDLIFDNKELFLLNGEYYIGAIEYELIDSLVVAKFYNDENNWNTEICNIQYYRNKDIVVNSKSNFFTDRSTVKDEDKDKKDYATVIKYGDFEEKSEKFEKAFREMKFPLSNLCTSLNGFIFYNSTNLAFYNEDYEDYLDEPELCILEGEYIIGTIKYRLIDHLLIAKYDKDAKNELSNIQYYVCEDLIIDSKKNIFCARP